MPLRIIQGPLPNDGTVVDPSTFLEAWISATQIFDLGPGAFQGQGEAQGAHFIYSSTEPPGPSTRDPHILWFKRGEGRLYVFDKPDSPSNITFTAKDWVAMSDRRDLFCMAMNPIRMGTPVQFSTGPSNLEEITTSSGSPIGGVPNVRRVLFAVSDSRQPSTAVSNVLQPHAWIALESAASGALFRVCEMGFCSMLMSSGTTGNPGFVAMSGNASETWYGLRAEPTQVTNPDRMWMAFATESAYSDGMNRRTVWKWASALLGSCQS